MDDNKKIRSSSDIKISDRTRIDISGIDEILSYDDESIILSVCGIRTVVRGSGLRVTVLSVEDGRISACGRIDAVICEEEMPRHTGVFSRLFGNR